ncbi:hypothetical protein ACSTJQ_12665 [Vibrio parahaemolyticus]
MFKKAVNTHQLYDTNYHDHLDSMVMWATGIYPDSGLMVVGTSDHRWFVEVDFGTDFDNCDGISRPHIAPYQEPTFFKSECEARNFAIEQIRVTDNTFEVLDLHGYFEKNGEDE